MAVYKLFPSADTTLYSAYPTMNTGLDEIVEISTDFKQGNPQNNGKLPQVSRTLIKFDTQELNNLFENIILDSSWRASIKLKTANVTGLSSTLKVVVNAVAEDWDMGNGQFLDSPLNTSGASWFYRNSLNTLNWDTGSYAIGVTGSYPVDRGIELQGGGSWYYDVEATQSFQYYTDPDISLNVTEIVGNWTSSLYPNYGLIVRQSSSQEFVDNIQAQSTLKYFSRDTDTIFPPELYIEWDDFTYETGSLTVLNTIPNTIILSGNKGKYRRDDKVRFRVNSRPKYPIKTWQTSSQYTTNYALPESSYYSIKDVYTNEVAIIQDSTYTKLSCDGTSSYFDVFMNGLEAERFYKIEVQTTINGNILTEIVGEFIISND